MTFRSSEIYRGTLVIRERHRRPSVKRTRLIQSDKYVVAVEVEMVIPVDEPSEPCYEPETVQLLREIKEHAERGDVTWLTRRGKVYAALEDTLGKDFEGRERVPSDEWRQQIRERNWRS